MKIILHIADVVLLSVFLLVAGTAAVLYAAGCRFYIVTTGSMEPAIPVGSLCVVDTGYSYDSVKAGDVISFSAGEGMTVTHRAQAITDEGIITKGDANNSQDNVPVTRESFMGRTVRTVPRLGSALTFLKSPPGLALAAAVFVLLLIPSFLMTERDKKESSQKTGVIQEKTE